MRCASGARYAIAFKMAILSLVCLPQVPLRAAAGLSSTTPQAVSRPTANSKLSTTPSSSSSSSSSTTNTAQSPVLLQRTEHSNYETWTPDAVVVGPTTKEGDGEGSETGSPSPLTEVAKTTTDKQDKGVAVVEKSCDIPVNRCDNVMVRKHGMCGCTQINPRKVKRSGIKKRSVLNKYRPQLN